MVAKTWTIVHATVAKLPGIGEIIQMMVGLITITIKPKAMQSLHSRVQSHQPQVKPSGSLSSSLGAHLSLRWRRVLWRCRPLPPGL